MQCLLVHVCVQPHLTLCDPVDCSPPSSSVQGIFQARILEWVAISHFRGSSLPRDRTLISCVSCIGRWILYHCTTWEAWQGIPNVSCQDALLGSQIWVLIFSFFLKILSLFFFFFLVILRELSAPVRLGMKNDRRLPRPRPMLNECSFSSLVACPQQGTDSKKRVTVSLNRPLSGSQVLFLYSGRAEAHDC